MEVTTSHQIPKMRKGFGQLKTEPFEALRKRNDFSLTTRILPTLCLGQLSLQLLLHSHLSVFNSSLFVETEVKYQRHTTSATDVTNLDTGEIAVPS
ncbi:hypothetical protein KUTeg_001382 [Tegillarca granosa]|uniref:Uncharacterized protein n=1 Tax=Tegillarca granosa TaxID=220873 RepID=A0ABQ9FU49_TEGGR|nr:hypothetical protein KUTeg_001382 [Tegillarca granosa]